MVVLYIYVNVHVKMYVLPILYKIIVLLIILLFFVRCELRNKETPTSRITHTQYLSILTRSYDNNIRLEKTKSGYCVA